MHSNVTLTIVASASGRKMLGPHRVMSCPYAASQSVRKGTGPIVDFEMSDLVATALETLADAIAIAPPASTNINKKSEQVAVRQIADEIQRDGAEQCADPGRS